MAERHDFFQVGATLAEDAPSYVERPADAELVEALSRGELCLVLAPRQTGKSSLMVRARIRLAERGVRSGMVDYQRGVEEANPDRFFDTLIARVARGLKLRADAMEWAREHAWLSPSERFARFLQDVVLAEADEAGASGVVIFFDEIDSVRKAPFSDDFFTTLRSLYNARAIEPELRRLSFVLSGTISKSSFIKDRSRTPFNVGTDIALDDFDREETEPFRRVLGDESGELIDRIFYWTGGQPLLVQKLAAAAYKWPPGERTPERLDREVERAFFRQEIKNDAHLKFIRDYLLDNRALLFRVLSTYDAVLGGERVAQDSRSEAHEQLRLAGVVRGEGGRLVPRNRIYSHIFNRKWVREHKPPPLRPRHLAFAGATVTLLAVTLVVAQLMIQAARPHLFPILPSLREVEVATPVPAYDLALGAKDAARAFLDGEPVPITGGMIRAQITDLPLGESRHKVRFEGWLTGVYEKEFKVLYYPGWQIRQLRADPVPSAGNGNRIGGLTFSKDGLSLAAWGAGSVRRWNPHTGELVGTLPGSLGQARSVAFSPDGRLIAAWGRENDPAAADRKLRLWSADGGELLGDMSFDRPVLDVSFSPDSQTMAVAGSGGLLELWNANTTQLLRTLKGHREDVWDVAFSPDSTMVASISVEEGALLFDVETGRLIQTFRDQNRDYAALAFSPGGEYLATTTNKPDRYSVTLWGVRSSPPPAQGIPSPQVVHEFQGHEDIVTSLAFSPDGSSLASGSKDKTVRLWNVRTRRLRSTLRGHADWVLSVAFSPDGKTVASGCRDGTVNLWWAAASF